MQDDKNPPWYVWIFEQIVEKPAAVMAVIGWIFAGCFYVDMREYLTESTAAISELKHQIQLDNQARMLKLDEISKQAEKLEYWHKEESRKNEK